MNPKEIEEKKIPELQAKNNRAFQKFKTKIFDCQDKEILFSVCLKYYDLCEPIESKENFFKHKLALFNGEIEELQKMTLTLCGEAINRDFCREILILLGKVPVPKDPVAIVLYKMFKTYSVSDSVSASDSASAISGS